MEKNLQKLREIIQVEMPRILEPEYPSSICFFTVNVSF